MRLRPPTITHHLRTLRLAGLIRITKDEDFHANSYAARPNALAAMYERLDAFLKGEEIGSNGDHPGCRH